MRTITIFFIAIFLIMHPAFADKSNEMLHRNPFKEFSKSTQGIMNINAYSIHALKLIGIFRRADERLAVIKDVDNHFYFMHLNESIGLEHATIAQILEDKIQLEWTVQGKRSTDYWES
jgi:Tfp pilus assembly protein PilP